MKMWIDAVAVVCLIALGGFLGQLSARVDPPTKRELKVCEIRLETTARNLRVLENSRCLIRDP